MNHGIAAGIAIVLFSLGSAVAASASPPSAFSSGGVQIERQTIEYTIRAGSPEARAAREWLARNAHLKPGIPVYDAKGFGDIRVSASVSARGGQSVDAPVPPWSGPSGPHKPGDTYHVSTCGGGVRQVWDFKWTVSNGQGLWICTHYEGTNVQNCEASA